MRQSPCCLILWVVLAPDVSRLAESFGTIDPKKPPTTIDVPQAYTRSFCQDEFFNTTPDPITGNVVKRQFNPLNTGSQAPEDSFCTSITVGSRFLDVQLGLQTPSPQWCNEGGRQSDPQACITAYASLNSGQLSPCIYDVDQKKCVLDQPNAKYCPYQSSEVCLICYDAEISGKALPPLSAGESITNVCNTITSKNPCNRAVIPIIPQGGTNPEDTSKTFFSCLWDWETNFCRWSLGPITCEPLVDIAYRRSLQSGEPVEVCAVVTDEAECRQTYTYENDMSYDETEYSPTNLPPNLVLCEWRSVDDGTGGECVKGDTTCPFTCEMTGVDRYTNVPERPVTDLSLTYGERVVENFCESDPKRRISADECRRYYTTSLNGNKESDPPPDNYPYNVHPCYYNPDFNVPTCQQDIRTGFEACH